MKELEEAHRLKKELDSLRPISKENELKIMQKFRLDWNYNSNHLEGNTLTFGETKALLLHNITAKGKPLKDHIEITGHDEAIKWIEDVVKQERPLTETFIRELHELLLNEPYKVRAITPEGQPTKRVIKVGEYKSKPNHVVTQTGETFYFASPEETPAMMEDLLSWYRDSISKKEIDPVILASEFHYRFIRIHPFDDGNGRIARILMNFIFMQFAYPPVVIKSEDKKNYFLALQQADGGNLTAFIEYITEQLIHSLNLMISGAKGEKIADVNDIDKAISLMKVKLDSISKPFKTNKSQKTILKVFDESLLPLFNQFYEKCKKLDSLYISTDFIIFIDSSGSRTPDYNTAVQKVRDEIKESTERLSVHYEFNHFNREGFEAFSHKSMIDITFFPTVYKVQNDSGKVGTVNFQIPYSDNLSVEQIHELVSHLVTDHTNLIDSHLSKS